MIFTLVDMTLDTLESPDFKIQISCILNHSLLTQLETICVSNPILHLQLIYILTVRFKKNL